MAAAPPEIDALPDDIRRVLREQAALMEAHYTPEELEAFNRRERLRVELLNARTRQRMLAFQRSIPAHVWRTHRWYRHYRPLPGTLTAAGVGCQRRPAGRAPRSRRIAGRGRARSPARKSDPEPELAPHHRWKAVA